MNDTQQKRSNYRFQTNDYMKWRNLSVLVTGATGSFGRKFVDILSKEYKPKRLVIFSRDELKQQEMIALGYSDPSLRYFIGDVRDKERLRMALRGIDVVVHAAALKQVPSCEYNPFEAIMTNVIGSRNIIEAAIEAGVSKVLALSTDKAVNPTNLYGATKLCAEKLFVQGNSYSGSCPTRFSCVRYGNVVGSRGSVIPLFMKQRQSGRVTITNSQMTRFWITLEQGVRFVIRSIGQMVGGEIYVPKIPSTSIVDLAQAIAPNCAVQEVGIRPGEKLHEALVSEHESMNTTELDDMYVIHPVQYAWRDTAVPVQGKKLPTGFSYTSDGNSWRLDIEAIRRLVEQEVQSIERRAIPAAAA